MGDMVAIRDLRNHASDVLRRVEAGESLTVTVSGRPVAQIVPLPRRRPYLTLDEIVANRAGAALLDELREMMPDTTEDIRDPWEKEADA
jgi:prevent-host-death family protein